MLFKKIYFQVKSLIQHTDVLYSAPPALISEKLWVNTSNSSQLHLFSLGSWNFTTGSWKNNWISTAIVLKETEQANTILE